MTFINFNIFDPYNICEYFRYVNKKEDEELSDTESFVNYIQDGRRYLSCAMLLILVSILYVKSYSEKKRNSLTPEISQLNDLNYLTLNNSKLATYTGLPEAENYMNLLFLENMGLVEMKKEFGSLRKDEIKLRVNLDIVSEIIALTKYKKSVEFNNLLSC